MAEVYTDQPVKLNEIGPDLPPAKFYRALNPKGGMVAVSEPENGKKEGIKNYKAYKLENNPQIQAKLSYKIDGKTIKKEKIEDQEVLNHILGSLAVKDGKKDSKQRVAANLMLKKLSKES